MQHATMQDSPPRLRLHEMLFQKRQNVGQTPEGMALLLNMPLEEYHSIESGQQQPHDETLKRICLIAEWNYHEVKQMVFNENALFSAPVSQAAKHMQSLTKVQGASTQQTGSFGTNYEPPAQTSVSPQGGLLGTRLREVRMQANQTEEIMALLLNMEVESYHALEHGASPSDEILRRISLVCDWNYYDLLALLRSEQASTLQPKKAEQPFGQGEVASLRFRQLTDAIFQYFPQLSTDAKTLLLAQIELLHDSVKQVCSKLPSSTHKKGAKEDHATTR